MEINNNISFVFDESYHTILASLLDLSLCGLHYCQYNYQAQLHIWKTSGNADEYTGVWGCE